MVGPVRKRRKRKGETGSGREERGKEARKTEEEDGEVPLSLPRFVEREPDSTFAYYAEL